MKRNMSSACALLLMVALLIVMLAGCGTSQTKPQPAPEPALLKESSAKSETPAPAETTQVPRGNKEEEKATAQDEAADMAAVGEEMAPLASKERFGIARLLEERADHNLIWVSIEEMLWVGADDHDLIEQYGLPQDLDGYDYELVPLEGENIYIAFKDGGTKFGILHDDVLTEECDWEAFAARLLKYREEFPDDSGIFVCFETRASDGMHEELAKIEECYVP